MGYEISLSNIFKIKHMSRHETSLRECFANLIPNLHIVRKPFSLQLETHSCSLAAAQLLGTGSCKGKEWANQRQVPWTGGPHANVVSRLVIGTW